MSLYCRRSIIFTQELNELELSELLGLDLLLELLELVELELGMCGYSAFRYAFPT